MLAHGEFVARQGIQCVFQLLRLGDREVARGNGAEGDVGDRELEDRATGGPGKRKAAAQKAAATRKRKAAKRSAAAKKAAKTRAKANA